MTNWDLPEGEDDYDPHEITFYTIGVEEVDTIWDDGVILAVIIALIKRGARDNRTLDWPSFEILFEDESGNWYARVSLYPDGV